MESSRRLAPLFLTTPVNTPAAFGWFGGVEEEDEAEEQQEETLRGWKTRGRDRSSCLLCFMNLALTLATDAEAIIHL